MDSSLRSDPLAGLDLFRELTRHERAALAGLMRPRSVLRGETLVVAGEPSESLFVVHHGTFDVFPAGMDGDESGAIARLRPGDVIGEIGFFAGTPRTATVIASRDAGVLELDGTGYQQAVAAAPAIVPALLAAVARRLGATTLRLPLPPRATEGQTVAVLPAGVEPVPPLFLERVRAALGAAGARVVDGGEVAERFGPDYDSAGVERWLSDLEWEGRLVAYVADPSLTDWTRRCVRQADTVLLVVRGPAPPPDLTPSERFVAEVHSSGSRRLVRIHDRRVGVVSGTRAWLERMEVFLHHHVSLEDDADFHSLVRFLTGRAVGYVAGGGGGFGPAHTGIFGAFRERGIPFDVVIGTSVGAALGAAFAMRRSPEEIDENTRHIFVVGRAFKRYTLPRYSLLDHTALEAALAHVSGAESMVEDCWHPFLAVATNLSTQQLEVIRSGPIWKAMRASSAIPGVLPPFLTDDGMMLVDGAVMDNAPLAPLQRLKSGPNLIVHFGRTEEQRLSFRNEDIPGRWRLLAALLNPFRRGLPGVPGPATVLMRSLMVHQRYDLPLGPHDLVLRPPPFPGSSFINFDEHTRVFTAAREWARTRIDALAEEGDPALVAMLAGAAGMPAPAATASEPVSIVSSSCSP